MHESKIPNPNDLIKAVTAITYRISDDFEAA